MNTLVIGQRHDIASCLPQPQRGAWVGANFEGEMIQSDFTCHQDLGKLAQASDLMDFQGCLSTLVSSYHPSTLGHS